ENAQEPVAVFDDGRRACAGTMLPVGDEGALCLKVINQRRLRGRRYDRKRRERGNGSTENTGEVAHKGREIEGLGKERSSGTGTQRRTHHREIRTAGGLRLRSSTVV